MASRGLVGGNGAGMKGRTFGVAFAIAAWLHAGRVKQEIRIQMANVVDAVDNVAAVLRQDLTKQSERIGQIEEGLGKLTSRVSVLETDVKDEGP